MVHLGRCRLGLVKMLVKKKTKDKDALAIMRMWVKHISAEVPCKWRWGAKRAACVLLESWGKARPGGKSQLPRTINRYPQPDRVPFAQAFISRFITTQITGAPLPSLFRLPRNPTGHISKVITTHCPHIMLSPLLQLVQYNN